MSFFTKTKVLVAIATVAFCASSFSVQAAMSRKPVDNIFYATSTNPLGLDPALVDDSDSANITSNIYESLVAFDKTSTDIVPRLATSWTISEDGLTYTFKLREGVKFHDGTDFNAEAVKFNIDRQMPENLVPKMSYAGLVYGDVESTTVIDPYTVQIKLKKASTPFMHNLAMCFAAPIVSPTALQKFNNNVSENPVGTGPYKFVAWDRGQQVILTRFDDYWGEKTKTQNLIVKTMPETSARVVALNNGELDIIFGIDATVIDELKKAGNVIYNKDGMNTNYIIYNCNAKQNKITIDKDVRRAISMAVNVPELVETLYKGYASPATTFLPTFVPGYSKDVKQVGYNPDEAKKILETKGIKELTIMTYTGARQYNSVGGQVLAEAVQSYLSKIGIKANLIVYDWATYKNKLITDNWDIAFMGWSGDNGDPDNFLNLFTTQDPINNQGLWHNDEYNKLIDDGITVPDGDKRNEIYKKAEQILADEAAILPISHAKLLFAMRPNIKDMLIHPVGLTFFDDVVKE